MNTLKNKKVFCVSYSQDVDEPTPLKPEVNNFRKEVQETVEGCSSVVLFCVIPKSISDVSYSEVAIKWVHSYLTDGFQQGDVKSISGLVWDQ